jgi:hypothetical protein
MMWWSFGWLGLGFLIKWIKELWEKRGRGVFNLMLLTLSFALIYLLFGVLTVTTWQALLIFVFWLIVALIVKVE